MFHQCLHGSTQCSFLNLFDSSKSALGILDRVIHVDINKFVIGNVNDLKLGLLTLNHCDGVVFLQAVSLSNEMHYDSEIDLRKYHYQESFTRGSNSMMVPKVSSLSWKLKARIAINEGLTTNVKIIVCQICEKKIFHEVTSGATTNGHLSSSTDAKTASPLSRKMYF